MGTLDKCFVAGAVLAGVRSLHGVESAGTVSCLPLSCGGTGTVWVERQAPPTASNDGPRVALASVAGDYFRTMHIPLIEGRRLLPRDSVSAATGVVINQAFAKEARPGQRRFYTVLISLFALAALLPAAAGVYGTVSHTVTQRARELAVRAALGASRAKLVGPVLQRGVRTAGWGMAIGLVGVWATTRVLSVLVYDIKAVDPLTVVAGGATLVLMAVLASALPALKAGRTPPVAALKAQ